MKNVPKIAMIVGASLLASSLPNTQAGAQGKKPAKDAAAPVNKKLADGFTMLPSGLEYKIVKHGNGTKKPMLTDHIEINIRVHIGDSTLFDSRKMNDNKPVPLPIVAARGPGDPMEGFMLMVVGDSAILRQPVDSLRKMGGAQPWMKDGTMMEYNVTLVSLKTDAEEKKAMAESSAKQTGIDEKLLQEYFKKNNIKPMKTASGLYYTIAKEGVGATIMAGQTADVNYTGMFLDGKKFDSNTDTAFHHTQAFAVEVGKGRVIKGWDEGLMLLRKGSKATFYIPSGLAYGPQERNPIPANAILMFEVEIMDVHDPAATAGASLTDYLAKNNIKATKTPSGLYYRIIKEGTGETAKPGQKVEMRYLGKLLDGKVFDGNMDESFNPKPGSGFTFTLGVGQVIKGWDEGIALLKKGTRATLYLPSNLAYGERGAGGSIPPNASLIFDVEVINIEK